MRIDEIQASAFGPFRLQTLTLSPGLNVIHGPNEAGKSTWFAAAYAGLVGRRRVRGRGTAAQAEFASRHKPWDSSQWSVGAAITLDNGSQYLLRHNLARGGAEILDPKSHRLIPLAQLEQDLGLKLETDGTLDGARILGLTRDSARSTIFVGQADVLRVLEDAGALQEFLERATTSSAVDVTAESGLEWLDLERRERVGVLHTGRRPHRAAQESLERARGTASQARDDLIRVMEAITRRKGLENQLEQTKRELVDLEVAAQWRHIRELRNRAVRVRLLSGQLDDNAKHAGPAEDEVLAEAIRVLGAYEARGELRDTPTGPSAQELEAELAALPEPPEGNLEPRPEVVRAREALLQAQAARDTHKQSAPAPPALHTGLPATELRSLAGRLERERPPLDSELGMKLEEVIREQKTAVAAYQTAVQARTEMVARNEAVEREHQQRLDEFTRQMDTFSERHVAFEAELRAFEERQAVARSPQATPISSFPAMAALGLGGVLLVAGVIAAFAFDRIAGGVVALLGMVAMTVGLVTRTATARRPTARTATPVGGAIPSQTRPDPPQAPTAPTPPVREPLPAVPPTREADPRIPRLRLEVELQEQAVRDHDTQRHADLELLDAQGLPTDPQQLLTLARAEDDRAGAAERLRLHQEQLTMFERRYHVSVQELADELEAPVDPENLNSVLEAYDAYAIACLNRAQQAKLAARRPDLKAALTTSREAEHAYTAAIGAMDRRIGALSEIVERAGGATGNQEEMHAWIKYWIQDQERLRQIEADRNRGRGSLEELLDGRTVKELEEEITAKVIAAGPEPEHVIDDPDQARANVERRRDGIHAQLTEVNVQGLGLAAEVALAIEREAEAESQLASVEELAHCLDLARDQLEESKQRAQSNIAPALETTIRPWLPRVTSGRYLDLEIEPQTLTIKVSEVTGAVRQAHLLSHGTTEQIYLLLRLALAKHLATQSETAPLILDDVTVQSDVKRTESVMELLHEVSRERQVVIFSQEPEVAEWARSRLDCGRDSVQDLATIERIG